MGSISEKQSRYDEARFQRWYALHARRFGLNKNPDDPAHEYDHRAAYKAGMGPDTEGHWPSQFKTDTSPERYKREPGGLYDTKNNFHLKRDRRYKSKLRVDSPAGVYPTSE